MQNYDINMFKGKMNGETKILLVFLAYKRSLYYKSKDESAKKSQNESLWNVLLSDIIVWISTASTEQDQGPAHRLYISASLAPTTDSTVLPV